jgi:hypothetical protein
MFIESLFTRIITELRQNCNRFYVLMWKGKCWSSLSMKS